MSPPPRSILLRLALTLSTLLLLASLLLWPLSYYRWDTFQYTTSSAWRCEINTSSPARLGIAEGIFPALPARGLTHSVCYPVGYEAYDNWFYSDRSEEDQLRDNHRLLGIEYRTSCCPAVNRRELYVPHSYLALLATITPATWLLTRNRHRKYRLAHNLCPQCAYDLRAHLPPAANSVLDPQSSSLPPRCPECGTPIPKA